MDYPTHPWSEILSEVSDAARDLVSKLVRYESGARLTAEQVGTPPMFLDNYADRDCRLSNILTSHRSDPRNEFP